MSLRIQRTPQPSDRSVMPLTDCSLCERLSDYLAQLRIDFPDYHNAPVAAYGDNNARLLIVGLAPGKHGANATGIPFIGDSAGGFIYRMLEQHGFCTDSTAEKPVLINCRITNAVKCLPPGNHPVASEVNQCNGYLKEEITQLPDHSIILALGQLAHKAIISAMGLRQATHVFGHAAEHELPHDLRLIDSYHCSKYNTQTGRLTEAMFSAVFESIREYLPDDRRS